MVQSHIHPYKKSRRKKEDQKAKKEDRERSAYDAALRHRVELSCYYFLTHTVSHGHSL
ncbi:hypothetical protein GBA52_013867 [Prunus armeniaca]|nr:hypothetical protein GBA52_013867 [Prunus armeniaca]